MKRLAATLSNLWDLAVPYFRSEDRWAGRALLAAVIVAELSSVTIMVLINRWYNRFYNSLQDRDWAAFVSAVEYFCVIAAMYVALAVYQNYLSQWLQIRWRRWLTSTYLGDWLDAGNHYRMQLLGERADNPDQRLADDIQLFVSSTLTIGVSLLNSIVTLLAFIAILWNLSAEAPLHLLGAAGAIPGYLVWAALCYAVFGTAFAHFIGSPLVGLNFERQRYEADFRFNLVRVRENAEQIALLGGEPSERNSLLARFGAIVGNWRAIMTRQKRLTFFTAGYSQAATIFPYIVISPAYFAGAIALGGIMQTASAFGSVQTALSFFVSSYTAIAEWRAVVARLTGFKASMAAGRAAAVEGPTLTTTPAEANIALKDVEVRLPSGPPLIAVDALHLPPAEPVLVTGATGSGKSTLFRVIAGIWPFGSGRISVPPGARVMLLPQRPYLPIASLIAATVYPALPGRFNAAEVSEVLTAVGLGKFVPRLDEEAHWNRVLSLGEQQRLAIARAILHAPDFLFLDEATASLDEASEARLYRLLAQRLPHTALISIGHRSTLAAFHRRNIEVVRDGDLQRLRERPAASSISPTPAPRSAGSGSR